MKELFHYDPNSCSYTEGSSAGLINAKNIWGDCSYIKGNAQYLTGEVSHITGDVSGLWGDATTASTYYSSKASMLFGKVDECLYQGTPIAEVL
jgi:hypothetical protein